MRQDGPWPPSSRQQRWRAGLGVRAGPGAEQVRGAVEPEHALRLLIGRRDGGLRRLNRRAGMSGAAEGTAAIVGARLTGLISLIVGLIRRGRSPVVTDRSRMEEIGGGDAGGPARPDRSQDLHRQGDQDDRKKIP